MAQPTDFPAESGNLNEIPQTRAADTPAGAAASRGLDFAQPDTWAHGLLDTVQARATPALLLVPGATASLVDALARACAARMPMLRIGTELTPAAFEGLPPRARVSVLEDPHLFPLRCAAACVARRVEELDFLSPYGSARVLHPFQLTAAEGPRRALFAAQQRVHATSALAPVLEWKTARSLRALCAHAPPPPPPPVQHPTEARRILFVIGSLATGGAERQLVTTALGMHRAGLIPHVALVAPGRAPDHFGATLARAGIPVHVLRAFPSLPPTALLPLLDVVHRVLGPVDGYLPTAINLVLRMIHAYAIDTVHCFLDFPSVVGGLAGVLAQVPRVVLGLRSVAPPAFPTLWSPCLRPGLRQLARHRAVRMTANSAAGADDYQRWLQVKDLSVRVIHNGVVAVPADDAACDAFRAAHRIAPGARIVAGLFRLVSEKDPDLFAAAAAFALRQRPDVVVVHAGGGAFSPAAQALLKPFADAHRFIALGDIEAPEVLLRSASVLMLTSRQEGLPNVLIEAQLQGTPVVSTDAGGARETFIDGETGSLVSGRSAEALAQAALRLADRSADPQLRVRIAASARAAFAEERMIAAMRALYAEPARSAQASPKT